MAIVAVPQYNHQYYLDHKDEIIERRKTHYEVNREAILAKHKACYAIDKEKFLARIRAYYLRNKEKVLNHKSRWSKHYLGQMRTEIVDFLGNKCALCGFGDLRVLQIDHINNNGNEERGIARNSSRYYSHIRDNPSEYQLLCANCNWLKELDNRKTKTRYYKNNILEVL